MFQRHLHRHADVHVVMSALDGNPQCLPVLISLGAALRSDVASSLREVIATEAWRHDLSVRREATHWHQKPRFGAFLDHGLETRRNRGPKSEHLHAALLTSPETRAALYRADAAQCPQHCRAEHGTFREERYADDYREALFGWYAAIQHAHACVVTAARWFHDADPSDPHRPEAFTDLMAARRRPHSDDAARQADPAIRHALQETVLMMQAWSPHTIEAIDVAFRKAEGEHLSHAWGLGFEPAGRGEAQAAAEALARVLSPHERQHVRDVIDALAADEDNDDSDLAKDTTLPCTSDRHRTHGSDTQAREDCAKARAIVYAEASQPWSADIDRGASADRLARYLLGARSDRAQDTLRAARSGVPREIIDTTPRIWHEQAKALRDARESSGLTVHTAAQHLSIKSETLQRFEDGTGKLPGRPAALGYLQLLVLACVQAGQLVPAGIPQTISQPVICLPITL
ncbi:helix-turn-helix domain-containing protein [Streptomyces sp. NPDC048508]|uniref:helix-turn-helix domain-containing protein n=1 Tax=Streptomyces sp. NPDC048508 TaxID=3365561 RepID=UPI00371AB0B0